MVEVLRDGYGIPHCYASSEHDAFFAQGWTHAADRLWQMEYDRRRGLGRWSEVVGARGVPVDVFFRRMDLVACVQRDIAAFAPDTTAMLDAYASGVNAAIASLPRTREFTVVAIEPEPWEPWHSVLVFRVRHLLMGSARTKLWRAVAADVVGRDAARTMVAGFGREQVACVPPGASCAGHELVGADTGVGDTDGGSNNWVLAGSRTASGLPLLAGDPHRELEAPNVYVQGHVACDAWDVLGIGIPGVPGFCHFGHNERVAWSITHAMADDQDLFAVPPGSVPVTRTERIAVRDGDDVDVDVVLTPRGPVIGAGVALCWTATTSIAGEANLGFDAMAPMLRARTVDELFDAMRPWVEPANSLLAADVDGTIGYLTRGRLPKRRRNEAAWLPVPLDDPSYAWDAWVPFDDMPRCVNPSGGYLFSANNRISADPSAPYIGIDTAAPGRARRIVAALDAMDGATVDDMTALHRDVVSHPARRVAARLAWQPLEGWDGTMAAESTAAAAYSVLRRELLLVVLERSGLGDVLTEARNRVLPGVVPETALWRAVEQHWDTDDTSLLGGWSWDDAVGEAAARAEKAWGGEPWGELHRTRHRHTLSHLDPSLDPARVQMAGDLDTVQAASYVPTVGFDMRAGSVARYAFDLADWDRSGWVLPLGAWGEPGTAHAGDQQEAWAAGRLVGAPYTRAAVEAVAVERVVLDGDDR